MLPQKVARHRRELRVFWNSAEALALLDHFFEIFCGVEFAHNMNGWTSFHLVDFRLDFVC